jgi:DNA-binding MarR family transcriptional regulator
MLPAPGDAHGWVLGVRLLLASRALFDELHRRLAAAGHDGLRPAHGFLFQSVGTRGATASEIAARLGMTKQAARLVVDELVDLGYVERRRDEQDARRRPVVLTARGQDALRRSEAIFEDLRAELEAELGPQAVAGGMRLLEAIDARFGPAPLRPVG